MIDANRWRCDDCWKIFHRDALLEAPNPFNKNGVIWGCPHCTSVDCFEDVCDEAGCNDIAACGFPTDGGGYRRTCYAHSVFAKESS